MKVLNSGTLAQKYQHQLNLFDKTRISFSIRRYIKLIQSPVMRTILMNYVTGGGFDEMAGRLKLMRTKEKGINFLVGLLLRDADAA